MRNVQVFDLLSSILRLSKTVSIKELQTFEVWCFTLVFRRPLELFSLVFN